MKRNFKTEKEKNSRRIIKEYESIRRKTVVYEKLEEPVHHGYYVYYEFNEKKYGKHKDADVIKGLINVCFGHKWVPKKGHGYFDKNTKQFFLTKPYEQKHLHLKFYNTLTLIQKKYIDIDFTYRNNIKIFSELNFSKLYHYVTLKRCKAYNTHRKVINMEDESYLERCYDMMEHNKKDFSIMFSYGKDSNWAKATRNRYLRRESRKVVNKAHLDIDSLYELTNDRRHDKTDNWW